MNKPSGAAARVTSTEHLWIPMPDGTRLAARLWLSEDGPARRPAIFEIIPYRKTDMVRARDEGNHVWLAQHGYACLRVDMRGSGDSDGVMADMYAQAELDDARHVIDWIARQDWCDGRVGMFGTSWGGTASLQASLDPPESLKAVIAVCATHDRYEDDIHHKGGGLLTDTFEWGATLPAILALPPSPASGGDWYERWRARLDALAFPVEHWVREEARGTYWRHGSIRHQADRIGCPVLSVGGWSDRYSNSVMSLVDARPDTVWGIVGPWGHHYPDKGHPGPGIGFQQVALDWFDRWLRPSGEAPDWPRLRVWLREFDPPVDVVDERRGGWMESGPPSEAAEDKCLWLAPGDLLAAEAPEDGAGWDVPHDLRHGLAGGDTGYFGRYGGLPLDQRQDDARSLCFDTGPLAEDHLLFGSVAVELALSAEEARSQICLRINDVAPDGASARVGLSILNLALDDALDAPEAPPGPGPRRVRMRFHTTAYRFRAGHRIRLAIGSSYWPMVWTPPRLGRIHITEGRLMLPLLQGMPEALKTPFPTPLDLPEVKTHEIAAAPPIRRWQTDDGETVSAGWHQPETSLHYRETDTSFSFETLAEHRLAPPNTCSVRSTFDHRMLLTRPDGTAEVSAWVEAACSPYDYILDGRIAVTWQGAEVFARRWTRRVPRRHS